MGDRVIALVEYNAWAEVVVAAAPHVYKMPPGMGYHEAAGFLMNYLAAYIMLFDVVGLRPGQSVLVHSAGGGVVSHSCTRHCLSLSFKAMSTNLCRVMLSASCLDCLCRVTPSAAV